MLFLPLLIFILPYISDRLEHKLEGEYGKSIADVMSMTDDEDAMLKVRMLFMTEAL